MFVCFLLFCTDGQNVHLLNYQPSSEHHVQQGRIVSGQCSFPVPNPDVNVHPPQDDDGYSDEDDSGFHNWFKDEMVYCDRTVIPWHQFSQFAP